MSEFKVIDIIEQDWVVDDRFYWKPDMSLLMRVANHKTVGTDEIELVKEEGGKPRRVIAQITLSIKDCDSDKG